MGCDIHLNLETYNERKDIWEDRNTYARNTYYNDYPEESEYSAVRMGESERRSYTLFAILANVRNYQDQYTPIAEPRGAPVGLNKYVAADLKQWEDDAHSTSYFTLAELRAAEDDYTHFTWSGYLSPRQVEELNKGQKPHSWNTTPNSDEYRLCEWEEEYDGIGQLIRDIEHSLKQQYYYLKSTNEDKVRIVFWFDN